MKATRISMLAVFITCVVLGDVISIIFVQGIHSDILAELPNSALPMVLRLLMIFVVITTIPLIIIPAGELVMDKLFGRGKDSSSRTIFIVRFLIAQLCALISVEVPNFVYVISFIGCFTVALASFAYPPLLHLRCLYKFYPVEKRHSKMKLVVADVILLVWGLVATGFTSVLTFRSMMQQMRKDD